MTDQEREEFEFRLRAEQEAEQAKDGVSKFEEYTGVSPSSPLLGGAVGVVAGIPAGRILEGAAKGATAPLPRTTVAGKTGASSGDKWLRNYANINKPNFSGGVPEAASIYQRTKGHGPVSEKVTQRFGPGAKLDIESYSRAQKARPFMEKVLSKTPEAVQRAGQAISGAGASVPAWLGRGIAGGSAGFQGVDAANRFEQGDYLGAAIGGLGALGSGAALIPHPLTRGLGTAVGTAAPFINEYLDRRRKRQEEQPEESAEGVFGFSEGGGTPKKRVAKAIVDTAVGKTPKALEDVIGLFKTNKVVKPSEAFGAHEGKTAHFTQSDRLKSIEGELGGHEFSSHQLTKPEYRDARAVWGVASPQEATKIINRNKKVPEGQSIWAPLIGSPTQHQTNPHVFDPMLEEFYRQVRLGKLSQETANDMMGALAKQKFGSGNRKGQLMFPNPPDIRNEDAIRALASTFENRGPLADILFAAKGSGKTKSQIIDYNNMLRSMADPSSLDAPTHSVGTRLFTLDNGVIYRPDLHSAFPHILTGADQGVSFTPIPKELALKDYIDTYRDFKGQEPGTWAFTRKPLSIDVTDKFIRRLEDAGYSKGGLACIK